MNDLQIKTKQLPGQTEPGICRAVDFRRKMLQVPEVIASLSPVDKMIFKAGAKRSISEISDRELADSIGMLSKYISRDTGIRNIDEYDVTRFMDMLQRYYSSLSLDEVKLAFEFAMTGELDPYLPKDKNGMPDKNHYQIFSAEYYTKILNAFLKRKNDADGKAYKALPQGRKEVSQAEKDYYNMYRKNNLYFAYLEYKYLGKVEIVNEFIIYQHLQSLGLAEPIRITDADQKGAVARLLKKSQVGLINRFVAQAISGMKEKHSDVPAEAMLIAKQRAISESFESMVEEEIQLYDYIY